MGLDSAAGQAELASQPLQFSLRTLLIVMTATAVFLSALFGGNVWIATTTVSLLLTAWPMVLAIVLIYRRGRARTFCIGALFPAVPRALQTTPDFTVALLRGRYAGSFGLEERLLLGLSCLVVLVASILFGVAAVGVRRLVESSARREQAIAPAEDPTAEAGRST